MHGPRPWVLFLFFGCLSGCAATVSIPLPVDAEARRDFDTRPGARSVLVRTGVGDSIRGMITIRGDSIAVRSPRGVEMFSIRPGTSIEYRDAGNGFRRGTRAGGLLGMAVGLAVGLSGGSSLCVEGCGNDESTAERVGGAIGTTVLGGIAGAAIGAPIGVVFGSKVRVEFRALDSRAREVREQK